MNTKRILSLILSLCMILTIATFPAMAATSGTCGDNVTWTLDDNGTLTISGTGDMHDYGRDYDYEGYADEAPWQDSDIRIENVVIKDGVTSIGNKAFHECGFFASITIPDSVTSIGKYAFTGCHHLTEIIVDKNNGYYSSYDGVLFNKAKTALVCYPSGKGDSYTIPNTVTTIGEGAFGACHNLDGVTISDSVTSIGNQAFVSCFNLESVIIPDSVTSIGESAFSGCDLLTSVAIGNGVNSIGDGAFRGCYNLTSIVIPEGAVLEDSCFSSFGVFGDCTALTSVTLPSTLTKIPDYAFSGCSSLSDVYYNGTKTQKDAIYIGSNNTYLTNATWHYVLCEQNGHTYDNAYDSNCNVCGAERVVVPEGLAYSISNGKVTITRYTGSATTVIIPSTIEGYPVTSIGDHAFDFCHNLTSVTLGDSVTEIGYSAFDNCSKLTNITVDTENQYYSSQDGILFSKDKTTLVKYPIGKTVTTYTIPDSVTSIGDYAFCSCDSLTSITIPDSVNTIGGGAFHGCSSLERITIPDSVTSIGSYAFSGCSSLTSITIPDSVTKIQNGAFKRCDSLTNITVDEENEIFSSQDGVLFNKDKTTIVAYPNGKTATTYTTPDSVTTIGMEAFRSCSSLVSITLGDSVTTIDSYAFAACDSLISITFGNSVTEIGMRAFEGCSSLTSVTVPASVTEIDLWAFADCTSLTGFTVDEESEYYCSQDGILFSKDKTTIVAYPGDKTASIYTIPESVTTIMPAAFSGCSSLTNIIIPDSMTTISSWAFQGCSSLTSIIIPDSVTTIYHYAFSDCSSLTSITIPDSVTKIGHCAFSSHGPLKDVYYIGTKEQKNSIVIEEYNTDLLDATWHYFDNACDTTCSDCSLTREAEDHVYTDDIDTDCNECGETREVPVIMVSNATAKVGNTFSVDVSIKNNSGIVGLRTYIGYDANVLELISATAGEDFVDTSFGPTTKNPFNIVWDDSLATESNTTNGVVATLTFKVKEGVKACDTEITLTYDPDDVYDFNMDNVGFATENGTITVFEYIPGDANGDGDVNNKDLGILRRWLNDWDVEIDELASDVNRDGKVNNKDMGILRRYLNDWDVELK